jgi:isopentenyl-diphosphate delta-isomerase
MADIILVDENDNEVGLCEKIKAHKDGLLHRAFSIFIFNDKNQLLLQKRSIDKYHSGGLWTNTVCSHPLPNEDINISALNRLQEEMGFKTKVKKSFSFLYKSEYKNGITEHEIDHIFFGLYNAKISFNHLEVMDYRWDSIENIKNDIFKNSNIYTSWFKLILDNKIFHKELKKFLKYN